MSNLAKELGVSLSTIQRDILALTVDEQYPLDTVQGNGGGVILSEYRHPHKHIFSREQIKVLTELTAIASTYQSEILNGLLRAYA
jgi:predicted DNA-binding transcriptional regulator YafY